MHLHIMQIQQQHPGITRANLEAFKLRGIFQALKTESKTRNMIYAAQNAQPVSNAILSAAKLNL